MNPEESKRFDTILDAITLAGAGAGATSGGGSSGSSGLENALSALQAQLQGASTHTITQICKTTRLFPTLVGQLISISECKAVLDRRSDLLSVLSIIEFTFGATKSNAKALIKAVPIRVQSQQHTNNQSSAASASSASPALSALLNLLSSFDFARFTHAQNEAAVVVVHALCKLLHELTVSCDLTLAAVMNIESNGAQLSTFWARVCALASPYAPPAPLAIATHSDSPPQPPAATTPGTTPLRPLPSPPPTPPSSGYTRHHHRERDFHTVGNSTAGGGGGGSSASSGSSGATPPTAPHTAQYHTHFAKMASVAAASAAGASAGSSGSSVETSPNAATNAALLIRPPPSPAIALNSSTAIGVSTTATAPSISISISTAHSSAVAGSIVTLPAAPRCRWAVCDMLFCCAADLLHALLCADVGRTVEPTASTGGAGSASSSVAVIVASLQDRYRATGILSLALKAFSSYFRTGLELEAVSTAAGAGAGAAGAVPMSSSSDEETKSPLSAPVTSSHVPLQHRRPASHHNAQSLMIRSSSRGEDRHSTAGASGDTESLDSPLPPSHAGAHASGHNHNPSVGRFSVLTGELMCRLLSVLMINNTENHRAMLLTPNAVSVLVHSIFDLSRAAALDAAVNPLLFAALSFYAAAQSGDKPMTAFVDRTWHQFAARSAASAPASFDRDEFALIRQNCDAAVTAYSAIGADCKKIKENSWDETSVKQVLSRLCVTCRASVCYRYFACSQPAFCRALLQCLNNIDEAIMKIALHTAVVFVVSNPPAQQLFIEQAALWALSSCLYDYNVSIKLLALDTLSLLASTRVTPAHSMYYYAGGASQMMHDMESVHTTLAAQTTHVYGASAGGANDNATNNASSNAAAVSLRNDLRRCGAIEHVLKLIRGYPSDDITLQVLEAATSLLAHTLTRLGGGPAQAATPAAAASAGNANASANNNAAAGSHTSDDGFRVNQEFARSKGGVSALVAALKHALRLLDASDRPVAGPIVVSSPAPAAVVAAAASNGGSKPSTAGSEGSKWSDDETDDIPAGKPKTSVVAGGGKKERPKTAVRRPTTAIHKPAPAPVPDTKQDVKSGDTKSDAGSGVERMDDPAPLYSAVQAALLALTNLIYRNVQCQNEFRTSGGFALCDGLLSWADRHHTATAAGASVGTALPSLFAADDITIVTLNCLINATDTNALAQDQFTTEQWRTHLFRLSSVSVAAAAIVATDAPAAGTGAGGSLSSSRGSSPAASLPSSRSSQRSSTAGGGGGGASMDGIRDETLSADSVRCLLLSHITWNHTRNQDFYATDDNIKKLLSCVALIGVDDAPLAAMMNADSKQPLSAAAAAAAGGAPPKSRTSPASASAAAAERKRQLRGSGGSSNVQNMLNTAGTGGTGGPIVISRRSSGSAISAGSSSGAGTGSSTGTGPTGGGGIGRRSHRLSSPNHVSISTATTTTSNPSVGTASSGGGGGGGGSGSGSTTPIGTSASGGSSSRPNSRPTSRPSSAKFRRRPTTATGGAAPPSALSTSYDDKTPDGSGTASLSNSTSTADAFPPPGSDDTVVDGAMDADDDAALGIKNDDAPSAMVGSTPKPIRTAHQPSKPIAVAVQPSPQQMAYRQQIAYYALLALINLTYQNRRVQDAIGRYDGIRRILTCLIPPEVQHQHWQSRGGGGSGVVIVPEETRRTAAFCLGNCVNKHASNARRLGDSGGVQLLVSILTDDDEDELSKKAFQTLVNADTASADRLTSAIHETVETIDSIAAALLTAMTTTAPVTPSGKPPSGSSTSSGGGSGSIGSLVVRLFAAFDLLAKYLPVFNGLIYMSTPLRDYVLDNYGLSPAMSVFTRLVSSSSIHARALSRLAQPSPRGLTAGASVSTPNSATGTGSSEQYALLRALKNAAGESDQKSNSAVAFVDDTDSPNSGAQRPASAASMGGTRGTASMGALRHRVVTVLDYAVNVLTNLSQNRSAIVQEQARKSGAFDSTELFIRRYGTGTTLNPYTASTLAVISATTAAATAASSGTGGGADHKLTIDPRRGSGGAITPRATAAVTGSTSRVVSLPSINAGRTTQSPNAHPSAAPVVIGALTMPAPAAQWRELIADLDADALACSTALSSEPESIRDVRLGAYGVLNNLIVDNPRNAMRVLSSPILMCRLVHDCYAAIGHAKRATASSAAGDDDAPSDSNGNALDWQVLSPAPELLVLACELSYLADSVASGTGSPTTSGTHVRRSSGGVSASHATGGGGLSGISIGSEPTAVYHHPRLGGTEWSGRVRLLIACFATAPRTGGGGVSDIVVARAMQLNRKIT